MKLLLNGLILSLLLVYCPLHAQFSVTIQIDHPVSCSGGSDAVLTAIVNPAGSTYSFAWSNGATTATVTDLSAGAYVVTVQNAAGGTAIGTAVLNDPAPLTLNAVTELPLPVNPTGSVEVETSGGTLPYAFQWENALQQVVSNEEDLLDAPAGNYMLSAVDANGCTAVLSPVELIQTSASPEADQLVLDIFPNPATTQLSFVPPNGENSPILIFNAGGTLFASQNLRGGTVLDVQNWPSGVYTLYFPELNLRKKVLVAH